MAVDCKYGKVTLEKGTIGEDEPVMVFRAQDELLPQVIEFYLQLCAKVGSPDNHLDKVLDAKEFIQDWQFKNPHKVPTSSSC